MTHTREAILRFVKSAPAEGVHLSQIIKFLGPGHAEHHVVKRTLEELVRQGELQKGRGKTFRPGAGKPHLEGHFTLARDGYGFVAVAGQEGRDIFVPKEHTGFATTGDTVRVREEFSRGGRRTGVVVDVVKRARTRMVGTLHRKGQTWFVVGADETPAVWVEPTSEAEPGDVVGVEITQWPSPRHPGMRGTISHILPPPTTASGLIERVVYRAGLPVDFGDDAAEQAAALPSQVNEEHWSGQREDWRQVPLVTIDGEDARDFDDAVAWMPARAGHGGTIYVAIADVAHYVPIQSPLDQQARLRGTSVYFPRRVIPMLPEALSNHLCSLRPREDRLAVGTKVQLNANFEPVAVSFHDVVIHSRARLTYTAVQQLFDAEPTTKTSAQLPERSLWPMLLQLRKVADALRAQRLAGGGLDLELPETSFELDEADGVKSVLMRRRTEATGLIEELMLLANQQVAQALDRAAVPAIYRIHEEPDDEKLRRFAVAASHASGCAREPRRTRPEEVQRILDECKDPVRRRVLYALLLRAMQRARYTADNVGHYGLGFGAYAHTTSPIRRYPDLVVQRLMKQHLIGTVDARPRAASPQIERLQRVLEEIASECSDTEQRAQAASWDAEAALKALYMSTRLGEVFAGVIGGVTARGLFVTLGETNVDGYLPISALPPDDYAFNERILTLTGRRTRRTFALGDQVPVAVASASPELGRIELAWSEAKQSRKRPARAATVGPAGRRAS